MIIKHQIVNEYTNYKVKIPFKSTDDVLVKSGDKLKVGDELLRRKESSKLYSFYVPDEIPVRAQDVKKYATCIHGELVKEGDVLVEKEMTGGLTVKKLISPTDGVVDMDRVESGYIDILGDEDIKTFKSSFTGDVLDTNLVDGIVLDAKAYAMDIKIVSKMCQEGHSESKKIFGEFVTVGDGDNLLLKADQKDYTNKIVFAGKYLHTSLLQDLFEKGAAFVLTYSMEYSDFRRQTLPLGILGGFGEISCGDSILSLITSKKGVLSVVDLEERQIFFLSDYRAGKKEKSFLLNAKGATVRSLALSNYSMIGKVIDTEEEAGYISVEWENGSKGIANIGAVEFISL